MAYRYLTPKSIMDASNIQTDENFTDAQLYVFFNQAISDMNNRLNINLPLITFPATGIAGEFLITTTYTPLPDIFMMSAVLYFMSYAIKAQDSSSVEAETFFQKYLSSIEDMKSKVALFLTGDNAQYLADEGNYAVVDFTGNYFNPNGVIVEEE